MIATGLNDFKLLEGFYFCSCLYPNCKNQIVSTHNATANHSGCYTAVNILNDSSYSSYFCSEPAENSFCFQLLFRAAKY